MPAWLRNLVMLVGLLVWSAVVAVTLLRGGLPDAAILGVPAFLVLALAPPAIGRARAQVAEREAPPEPQGEGVTS